jgi:hypothetical protein
MCKKVQEIIFWVFLKNVCNIACIFFIIKKRNTHQTLLHTSAGSVGKVFGVLITISYRVIFVQIGEPLAPRIWEKKTRIKGPDIPVISQTHRIARFHERTLGFLGSYLTFFVFLRTTVIYQNQVF